MIQVVPYTCFDGIPTFRDSEIMELYHRIIRDGSGYMFQDGQIKDERDFLRAMKSALVGIAMDGVTPAGIIWLNRLEHKSARLHFVIFREYWGKGGSEKVGKPLCRYMLTIPEGDGYLIDMMWGFVPTENEFAIRYSKKCGAVEVGELPLGLWDDRVKKGVPAVIFYMTRNEL
jgi:RimJ/RimL family protein N-acetyltransferase